MLRTKDESAIAVAASGQSALARPAASDKPAFPASPGRGRNLDKSRETKCGSTKALCCANPADAFYTYFSIFPMIRMYGVVVLPKSKETSSPVNCMENV